MAMSAFTARCLAPFSFITNFAAQLYGILSDPNMKDIHDNNLSFWSPEPFLIATFFFPQQLFQLAFIYRLFKLDARNSSEKKKELDLLLDYVPYLSIANICLAIWMMFWNQSYLKTSNIFVVIGCFTQIYYILDRQSTMNIRSPSSLITHILSKTLAGIGVLDLMHNGSVAYFDHQGPNIVIMILTGLGFALLASMSDWILGGCLAYDLVALSVGQRGIGETNWSNVLAIFAIGTSGIVGLKNLIRPPYEQYEITGYDVVSGDQSTI